MEIEALFIRAERRLIVRTNRVSLLNDDYLFSNQKA